MIMDNEVNILEDVPCTVIDKNNGTYVNEESLKNVICSGVFDRGDVTINIKNNAVERDGKKFNSFVIKIERSGESMSDYIRTQRKYEKFL